MGNKEKAAQAAEAVLEPGEIVEMAAIATIGPARVGRAIAIGAATAIATAGMFSVMVTPKRMPIVLTSKRLLVLGWKGVVSEVPDSKILSEVPRSDLRAKPAKRVMLYHQVDLTDPEGKPVSRMKMALFDGGDARRLALALGEAPPQGAASRK